MCRRSSAHREPGPSAGAAVENDHPASYGKLPARHAVAIARPTVARCAQPDFTPSVEPSNSTSYPIPSRARARSSSTSPTPRSTRSTCGSRRDRSVPRPPTCRGPPAREASGHVDGRPVLVRGGGLGVIRPGTVLQQDRGARGLAAACRPTSSTSPRSPPCQSPGSPPGCAFTVAPSSGRSIVC